MTIDADAHDPLHLAQVWSREGREVALATVIETWGSAPRPIGSHLVIDADGNFDGSVSGGCVEGAVVAEAVDIIASGAARVLSFGVADETAWQVGLSCGGQIRVLVQKLGAGLDPSSLSRLHDLRSARQAAASRTELATGRTTVFGEDKSGPEDVRAALASGFPKLSADGLAFINIYRPLPRLVIIGAVHIAQALVPIAEIAGFATLVIDPRTAFATPERFAGVDLVADWPEDVLPERPLDAYTALAAITHDPKIDDTALKAAIEAGCFYVGALGSRKTHGRRVERLQALGLAPEAIARISAPIGLSIGAATPAEIAVSILADVIQSLRVRPASDSVLLAPKRAGTVEA
ncbi:XdhC/CoxI family protein [Rhizobium sp. Leaf371]|uniref:XdhC family protein n=1 Tax=Rhizobium sp. Leaf371 TaxID=1736355 RepID=UPI0007136213|nr:XdhC family protein [Rhizobium sp. Leaf371]KQS72922.1 XdhC/CoxI family protein [Rhizobium sp. Leaf371]